MPEIACAPQTTRTLDKSRPVPEFARSPHVSRSYHTQAPPNHTWIKKPKKNQIVYTNSVRQGWKYTTYTGKFVKWNDMKCRVSNFKWIEMKWNFTHSSSVDVKWKLMKLFFTNDREMRWNEVNFMKFSETRPLQPTTKFIEFYQKSKSQSLYSYKTFRPTDLSCTPWTRDSSGGWQACESPRLLDSRVSQTQPTWHKIRHTHRTTQCSSRRG